MKPETLLKVLDKEFELFLPYSRIIQRIEELGTELNADFDGQKPVFVPVLNGSFMFASDLIREICIPCEVSFVKAASYSGTHSSGVVQQLIGLDERQAEGRHLILVEDIVDTGRTLDAMLTAFKQLKPASIRIASLFVKPDAYKEKHVIQYCGFEIPDKFIIGYGLDYNGFGRNYRDVYCLHGLA